MPLYLICSVEPRRYDRNVEVALAVPGAFVTCVQLTLVLQQKFHWFKCFRQAIFDAVSPVVRHGRTSLNGLTVTSL